VKPGNRVRDAQGREGTVTERWGRLEVVVFWDDRTQTTCPIYCLEVLR
jgi:hypothetical protein